MIQKEKAGSATAFDIGDWLGAIGTVTGRSSPITITQERVDAFGEVTEDRQFLHTDPVRAANGPFGGTIAHGFLVLSLLSPMAIEALPETLGAEAVINRGFDKVRFVTPVRVGRAVRADFTLGSAELKDNALRLTHDVTVTIEEDGATALAARWLTMIALKETVA